MPGSSNTSFIPKHNPIKQKKRNASRPLFIGTLIIRIFFFAVLMATLGIFVYEKQVDKKLSEEVLRFNTAKTSFSEEDMQKVLGIDKRIKQVQERMKYTASIASLMKAIEDTTIQTVQIESLDLERLSDSEFEIEATMITESFDSVMSQRGFLERNDKLEVLSVNDLQLTNPEKDVFNSNNNVAINSDTETSINFKTKLTVVTEGFPHTIVTNTQFQQTQNENNIGNVDTVLIESSDQVNNQIDL